MNDAIFHKKDQEIDYSETLDNVAAVNALLRSAKENRVVSLEENFLQCMSHVG